MGKRNRFLSYRNARSGARTAYRTGWAFAREAAASLLTYELYPLGIPTGSMPVLTLPRLRQSATRPHVPILFIHGLLHNPSTFAWLKQRLANAGFKNFSDMNLATVTYSIPELAQQTATAVDALLAKYDVPHVDIIGHSMGGLVGRYYVQKLGGDGKVRNLITLGTPHQGTALSRYFRFSNVKCLNPNSDFLSDLQSCPLPQHTRVVAVSGNMDILMWPRDCVRWEGVRNIALPGLGHAGLLFSRRVLQIVLAHLHPELLHETAASSAPLAG